MKELPKEFQFKCDEHSTEQCKVLGVDTVYYPISKFYKDEYFSVRNNIIVDYVYKEEWGKLPIIKLSDYIESEERNVEANETLTDKEKQLIQHYAGLAMQGLLTRVPKRPNGEVDLGILEMKRIPQESISIAKEMVKQLKRKGYL